MTTRFLPQARWEVAKPAEPKPTTSKPVASRSTLNRSARKPEERQMTVAAESAPLRVTYGRDRIGAQVADVLLYGSQWVIVAVWGEGPIDAVESVTFDDKALPSGVTVTHYLGTAGQTADPTLVTAYAANGVTYTDTLPGVAYSVFRAPTATLKDFPSIAAVIRGRLVLDPRTGLTGYSTNPALATADFLSNDTYGAGLAVDWASVEAVADADDALVGGVPRRVLNLTLDTPQDPYAWADVLRAYAGCLIVPGNAGLKLVPDGVVAPVAHFDHDAGNLLSISPLRTRDVSDAPTVMIVHYTDASATPWKEVSVSVSAPGVSVGTTPRRVSEVQMPGIQSASQATREATERLNKLTLTDLSFSIDVFDEALAIEPGDVVQVSHPVGLSAKAMRVVNASGENGRYILDLTEYDPAAYSGAVITEPTTPDTNLPDPGDPPPVTDLVLTEERFQQRNGTYSSRIRATWTAPDFPVGFISLYRVNVRTGGEVVFSGTAGSDALAWVMPAVQEAVSYQVDVITLARVGAASEAASASIVPLGKAMFPGDVPSLSGFEVGGEVRLAWEPAADLDIWRYEIRYVAVAGTWASALLLDRTDSLRFTTKDVPAGTWDFMVKAVDSVGQYSEIEARRTITVTLDTAAYLVDSYEFDSPTVTGMAEYQLGRTDTARHFVTEDGVDIATKFSADLSTYTQPLVTYNTVASSLTTETEDFGMVLSGNWRAEATISDIVGTHAAHLDIGPDGTAWTTYPLTAKTSGRFARMRVEATSGEVIQVDLPALVRIDAVARSEDGQDTSLASGGKTITLVGEYASVKSVTITPLGTSARSFAVDNVVIGDPTSFDVYLFDSTSGAQVAGGFQWTFNGV